MAQNNASAMESVNLKLEEAMSLKIISPSSDVNFMFTSKKDAERGIEKANATIINVNSSADWLVKFDADNHSFFVPQNNKSNMNRLSADALKLRTGFISSGMKRGLVDYAPLSSGLGGANIASGKRGFNQSFGIDYKANLSPDIPEDIYKIDIRYTISKH